MRVVVLLLVLVLVVTTGKQSQLPGLALGGSLTTVASYFLSILFGLCLVAFSTPMPYFLKIK